VNDPYPAQLTVFAAATRENQLFRAGAPLCYLIITAGKTPKEPRA
jgi:hypothetical protein